jgi:hypothetical protein
MHGIGTLVFANGDKYIGEFVDNVRHGHGLYGLLLWLLFELLCIEPRFYRTVDTYPPMAMYMRVYL